MRDRTSFHGGVVLSSFVRTERALSRCCSLKVTLMKAFSEGVSKFKVDKLSLYLVEREGVLALTLPGFQFNVVADIPQGSWVSPLQIHLDDRLKIR